MKDFFIVSYATIAGGHEHSHTSICECVFVAGTDTPAFRSLPNPDSIYYVTHVINFLTVHKTWRLSKDTGKMQKQWTATNYFDTQVVA